MDIDARRQSQLGAALVAAIALAAPANAATLRVANNGVDGAGCGTTTSPCRSLSRAIANAVAGDRIIVGPGRYGDLDRDGTFGESGEETGAGCSGNGCMILVN